MASNLEVIQQIREALSFENAYSDESKKKFQEVISILYKNFSKEALDKIPISKLDLFVKKIKFYNNLNTTTEISKKVEDDVIAYVRIRHFNNTMRELFDFLDNIPSSDLPVYISKITKEVYDEIERFKFLNPEDTYHIRLLKLYEEIFNSYEQNQDSYVAIQKLLKLCDDYPSVKELMDHDFRLFVSRLKSEEPYFDDDEKNKPLDS